MNEKQWYQDPAKVLTVIIFLLVLGRWVYDGMLAPPPEIPPGLSQKLDKIEAEIQDVKAMQQPPQPANNE